MSAMRRALPVLLAACFVGCGSYDLTIVVEPPEGLDAERLEVTIFEPAQDIAGACEALAFGDLDPASLAGAQAGYIADLSAGIEDLEVARAGQKIFALRGFDAEGREVARGCAEHGEIDEGGVVVNIPVEPVAFVSVDLDIEVLEPGARGDRVLFVRVEDLSGAPIDGARLRARRCRPGAECEESEVLFTPDTSGAMRLRPDRAPPGPFRLELRARFGDRAITTTGTSLPDPVELAGLVHPLRRPVRVGGGLGFAAWSPGVGLEIGVLEGGELRSVVGDERAVFTVLPSAVGLDGPESMVPALLTDGTLQMLDATLTSRGPEASVSLPADLTGVNVTGPFPAGACALGDAAPFFVQVTQDDAPFSTTRYGGAGPAPVGGVLGSLCAEVPELGPTRFLELQANGERGIFLPAGDQGVPVPSFRTANVERRRADGGADLVYAHLLPPLNELRLDTIEARLDDEAGLRFVPAPGGAPTPGIVFALASGRVTSPDVLERDGVEELVFLVGEVELFPQFELLEGARLGVVSGPLDADAGYVATVDLPECAFAVSCALALGDVDDDGADEILIGRSDFGDGVARAMVIDLSP